MAMPRIEGGMSLTTCPSIVSVPPADAFETGDGPQERRLPAARRADEHDKLAGADVEIDAMQDLEAPVGLPQIPQNQIGHVLLPLAPSGADFSSARVLRTLQGRLPNHAP